jgi:hypothetical protein
VAAKGQRWWFALNSFSGALGFGFSAGGLFSFSFSFVSSSDLFFSFFSFFLSAKASGEGGLLWQKISRKTGGWFQGVGK